MLLVAGPEQVPVGKRSLQPHRPSAAHVHTSATDCIAIKSKRTTWPGGYCKDVLALRAQGSHRPSRSQARVSCYRKYRPQTLLDLCLEEQVSKWEQKEYTSESKTATFQPRLPLPNS